MSHARAYYRDAYTRQFTAAVTAVHRVSAPDSFLIELDRTYFYPLSGGQPADKGTLNGMPVIDVLFDEATQAIRHLLLTQEQPPVPGSMVEGHLDWPRRFDHMQQHTGQHILSQAFVEIIEADTVGFHLGEESCTIDLNRPSLSTESLLAAERLANQVVIQNLPVDIQFVTLEEAAALPLRRRPEINGDRLRLIKIGDFDLNACGGTHVRQTGEVGLIKVTRVETRRDKARVEFRCGWRAITHYDSLVSIANTLSSDFTTAFEAVPAAARKLREERKALQKALRAAQKEALSARCERLASQFVRLDSLKSDLLSLCLDGASDPGELVALASELTRQPDRIILLGHPHGQILFKKSADLRLDLGQLLQTLIEEFGGGSGGGGVDFARGQLDQSSEPAIRRLLEAAKIAVANWGKRETN